MPAIEAEGAPLTSTSGAAHEFGCGNEEDEDEAFDEEEEEEAELCLLLLLLLLEFVDES